MISLMTTSSGSAWLGVLVGVGVLVAVLVGDGVTVTVAVEVSVGVGVRVVVGPLVRVAVGVFVGVAVGGSGLAVPGDPRSPALPDQGLVDGCQFPPRLLSRPGPSSAKDAPSGLGNVVPPS